MNVSVLVAVLGLLGSVAAVIIANRYTSRTARRAVETSERLETRKLDASTWKDQYEGWKDDAMKLRQLRDDDAAKSERALAALQTKVNEFASKIATMEQRIDKLSRERAEQQTYLDSLVSWCRVVVVLLRQAGVAYPPVPPGVVSDDPKGFWSQYAPESD